MDANNFGYFAKDVAIQIGITTSTLRRWAIELEKSGYYFERNKKEQRIYYERDFKTFRELKKMLASNVSFADAIKITVSTNELNQNKEKTPSVQIDEVRLSTRELEEIVNRAVEGAIEKDRERMFQVFEERLNQELERREKLFIDEIKKEQEKKQQLIETTAATEEESQDPKENNEQKPKKRSFFQRIFNK